MNDPPFVLQKIIQRAIAAFNQRDFAAAERLCRQVLAAQPNDFHALNLLGFVAAQSGRNGEALELLQRAVSANPTDFGALNNYGAMLQNAGRHESALGCYEQVIRLRPDSAEAHNNRGFVLRELNRLDEALHSCDQALRLRPDYADAHNNRGTVLQELERFVEALTCYERAIELKPGLAGAHSNRGYVLAILDRFDEALQSCEEAIRLNPDVAEAHNNRGIALRESGRTSAAVASYDRSIELKSDYAAAYANRGAALAELGAIDAALASFDKAIAVRPDDADAHWSKAVMLLLIGDYAAGWPLLEWRWQRRHLTSPRRNGPEPLWLGKESLAAKTILLHCEQGLGDTIQFCRYARRVADLGARVILEAPDPLVPLLSTLDGVSQLVATGGPLPSYDYQCPLMSLPLAFGTELTTIPAPIPYLAADPMKSRCWQDRLGTKKGLRVGLVWAGGFRPDQPKTWSVNARRNIGLARLARLGDPRIEFYSLQKGELAEAELAGMKAKASGGLEIIDYTRELHDFSDTAAFIDNLDLVIAVDTSVAHLAGALGKPVWVLNRFDTCWRWLLERPDSPWYPTLRLYRQERRGDWEGVVDRVKVDLDRRLREAS